MKNLKNLLALMALSALTMMSCSKPGCTDERSSNYSEEANEDDGSCYYRGDITFWCLPAVSESLIEAGHTKLSFELEGEIADTVKTENFFAPGGECNTPGVKTIPQEEMPHHFRYFKYRVKGNGGVTLWEDFVNLHANECLSIELTE